MALTNLTSAPSQQLATPSYDALFQGTAQGEAAKMAGAKFQADSIREGLQNFEKNQQLLSKHMGIFQGAITTNPEFKSAIESLDPKSDMGKAVQEASRGNASLTSMLALSNFASEYGAGELAQTQMAQAEQVTRGLELENNAAQQTEIVIDMLDNLIGTDGLINPAKISQAVDDARKLGNVQDGFLSALNQQLEVYNNMGMIKKPLVAPQITPVYVDPDDKTSELKAYVVSDNNGRPVTTIDITNDQVDYTTEGQVNGFLRTIEALSKLKGSDGEPLYTGVELATLRKNGINDIIRKGDASSNNAVGQAYNIVLNQFNQTPYINGKPNPTFWNEVTRIIKLKLHGVKLSPEKVQQTMDQFINSIMVEQGITDINELDRIQANATDSLIKAQSSNSGWE